MPPTVQFILQNKNFFQAQLANVVGYGCLSECCRAIAPQQNKRIKSINSDRNFKKEFYKKINHFTFCLSLSSSITSCSSRPLLTHSAFS